MSPGRSALLEPKVPAPPSAAVSEPRPRSTWADRLGAWPWRAVAGILAAAFAVVGLVMLTGLALRSREEPWASRELSDAHVALRADPKNEVLKDRIRALDLELRRDYFRRLDRNRTGGYLLLAGGALALGAMARSRRGTGGPVPRARDALSSRDASAQPLRRSVQWSGAILMAAGVVVAAVGWGRSLRLETAVPPATPGIALVAGGSAAAGAASVDPARTWPRFRGPQGAGVTVGMALPPKWDFKTRENVAWRTEIPLEGYNSPVVWADRVFVTGGQRQERLVFALDAASGAVVWQHAVTPAGQPVPAVEPPDQSGMAASSVAVDGERVYAIFATGELGALDFTGRLVWHKKFDLSDNGYGHASSLVVQDGVLLVQLDRGQPEDGKSEVFALNAADGAVRWRAARPVGGSWTTPVVSGAGAQAQVVLAGDPWLMAYDLGSGRELWRASVLGGELAPSPVLAGDLVIATSPGHALMALRSGGQGDVTTSAVVWALKQEIPDVPTPLVVGDLLFTADTEGHVHAREVATGAKVWTMALEMEIQASPLAVGDRMLLFAQPGTVVVLQAMREMKELARFESGEEIYATPAATADGLWVRTKKAVARIAAGPAAPATAATAGKEASRAP